ncbi:ALG6, ALG8 glycosyltransferase family domain-containing protein [Ditylenchus destructor]|uniref:Alpha-1,3-glucosyltransferase n=1 Tax=Ditylenchus destructor TaxID=166010 RepID=A0AAD4N3E6_9BILA|nr:ALG6, ALG8 glycosyltransferase family domain-containing protein [Ditylenchus destructor]
MPNSSKNRPSKAEVKLKPLSESNFRVAQIPDSSRRAVKDQLHKSVTDSFEYFDALSYKYCEVLAVVIFVVLQCVVSTGHYSGHNTPPMFGDFEAQRHWMEITVHLPPEEWYVNSTKNDLNYWGLDYPPLTAYHSWLLGKISEQLNPTWVALTISRGIEAPHHKLFMRLSVVISMTLLYAPAVLLFMREVAAKLKPVDRFQFLVAALCYPGLIFVDNGHFQYNHIALALFLWSVWHFEKRRYLLGSLLFVLALNFKQMELYHALPIFVFLLSRSVSRRGAILERVTTSLCNLTKLGATVVLPFALLWFPFLISFSDGGIRLNVDLTLKVLRRLFPLSRGVFEDKVANFWCCVSVVFKFKNLYSNETLALISATMVLASVVPSLLILLKYPSDRNFRASLVISSLSFYLFSFQVHEKTILMVAIPALLMLSEMPQAIPWFLSVSMFSMYPLCIKDNMPEILPLFITYHFFSSSIIAVEKSRTNMVISYLRLFNFVIAMLICALLLFATPPARYPHLFDMFNALFSFAHFSMFWLYLNARLIHWNCFKATGKVKVS